MEVFIVILIILAIIYWTWEILLMLFLLYGIGLVAKAIYKSSCTHAVLYMYLWLVYGGFAFLLLCIPITHVRWFEHKKSWLDDVYQLVLYSTTVNNDRDIFIGFILDNNLYTTTSPNSSDKYKLYNRLTSQDSEHLYLDFYVGMPSYKFFFINQREEKQSLHYEYKPDDFYKRYELLDDVNFVCNGIFVNEKLEGVVLQVPHDYYYVDTIPDLSKLRDRFAKKFGPPHESKSYLTNYVAKWIFDDKHIIIASIENGLHFGPLQDGSHFTGVIIYNPHAVLPLIEELKSKRHQIVNETKQKKLRKREEQRQFLIRQQKEQEAARQLEIADSVSALKKKNEVQNGF